MAYGPTGSLGLRGWTSPAPHWNGMEYALILFFFGQALPRTPLAGSRELTSLPPDLLVGWWGERTPCPFPFLRPLWPHNIAAFAYGASLLDAFSVSISAPTAPRFTPDLDNPQFHKCWISLAVMVSACTQYARIHTSGMGFLAKCLRLCSTVTYESWLKH